MSEPCADGKPVDILLVEDSPADARLTQLALRQENLVDRAIPPLVSAFVNVPGL